MVWVPAVAIVGSRAPRQPRLSERTQTASCFAPCASSGLADAPVLPRCQSLSPLDMDNDDDSVARPVCLMGRLTFGHPVQDHVNQTIGASSCSPIAVYQSRGRMHRVKREKTCRTSQDRDLGAMMIRDREHVPLALETRDPATRVRAAFHRENCGSWHRSADLVPQSMCQALDM